MVGVGREFAGRGFTAEKNAGGREGRRGLAAMEGGSRDGGWPDMVAWIRSPLWIRVN